MEYDTKALVVKHMQGLRSHVNGFYMRSLTGRLWFVCCVLFSPVDSHDVGSLTVMAWAVIEHELINAIALRNSQVGNWILFRIYLHRLLHYRAFSVPYFRVCLYHNNNNNI